MHTKFSHLAGTSARRSGSIHSNDDISSVLEKPVKEMDTETSVKPTITPALIIRNFEAHFGSLANER